jgi:hypothetical protein
VTPVQKHRNRLPLVALATTLFVALAMPAVADAGVAISTAPDLPGGSRAGSTVSVAEQGIPGQVVITQSFSGADLGATARLFLIRLSVNCGPGPSPGNPDPSGPAINTPETPCSNPDVGVFSPLAATGAGSQACAGTTFTITAPSSQGEVDLVPGTPVNLTHGQTCAISFSFAVVRLPSLDTFPNVAGMNTTSVSAVRSEIVSDPGNPGAVGLQAAALGSGGAVLVQPAKSGGTAGKKGGSPKLHIKGVCVGKRLRAKVTGKGIKKVTYLLDGRVVRVVKKSPYKLNTLVRNLGAGRHKLTASIKRKSGKATKVITKNFSRCRAPNFTG